MKATRLISIVTLLGLCLSAFAQRYLVFGRDPQIPGGVTVEQAKNMGWKPFQLRSDRFLTMWGAHNESVTGWAQRGTWVAWDSSGNLRIMKCGNRTNIVCEIVKIPGKTVVEYRIKIVKEVVKELVEVPGPERTIVVERPCPYPQYFPVILMAPQQQYIGNLPPPTVISPTMGGISVVAGGGTSIKNTVLAEGGAGGSGYGAAAAAAAAAAGSSSTSTAPGAAAGTSGGSSGSSGSSAGGGGSGSNSKGR